MSGAPGSLPKDLEDLAGAIAAPPAGAALPPAAPSSPASPAPSSRIDYLQEARELWRIVGMLSLRWPSLEPVYSEPTIERLAQAWAPVLERHQLDLGKFTIYLVAGTATLPILGDTWKAVRRDQRAAATAPSAPASPPNAPAAAPAAPPPADPSAAPKPPDPFAGRAV